LSITISSPARVSRVFVLLKVASKYRRLKIKQKLKMPLEITHVLTIFLEHGMIADIPR